MTNREKTLIGMSNDIELLAKTLIKSKLEDCGDYDYDEEWISNYQESYTSPNGMKYNYYCYCDCLKDTIEWLGSEVE